jgi:hypothetical protein
MTADSGVTALYLAHAVGLIRLAIVSPCAVGPAIAQCRLACFG